MSLELDVQIGLADQRVLRFAKCELPQVIRQAGSSRFVASMMGAANRAVGSVDVCALFRYDDSAQSFNFGTASRVSEVAAQRTAERYVAGLGLYDPVCRAIRDIVKDETCGVFHLLREKIDHPGYREMCFVRTGTLERMSILCRDELSWYSLGFYRMHQSGRFARPELDALTELAPLLSSLVLKHVQLSGSTPIVFAQSAERDIRQRLLDHASELSERELQICVLIVLGHSSESIALKCGISTNTVLTYRKRAYAKLRVSSQNELFRICLN
ncbi:MAG: helix-turn-helix transcriptional regulator [Burkholderiales bacterium]|nr:helix-turn-helix transcriptional regulator [Burkholderiales bacterium]